MIEEVYLAGGCLWGVQEFIRHVPGVVKTEAGRANGSCSSTSGPYDDYVEFVNQNRQYFKDVEEFIILGSDWAESIAEQVWNKLEKEKEM